jgi:hypothetical protein
MPRRRKTGIDRGFSYSTGFELKTTRNKRNLAVMNPAESNLQLHLTCPDCQAQLLATRMLESGTRLVCPGCRNILTWKIHPVTKTVKQIARITRAKKESTRPHSSAPDTVVIDNQNSVSVNPNGKQTSARSDNGSGNAARISTLTALDTSSARSRIGDLEQDLNDTQASVVELADKLADVDQKLTAVRH